MKRLIFSVALSALPIGVITTAPPASAQLFGGGVVYDPANHVQNILTAVRSCKKSISRLSNLPTKLRCWKTWPAISKRLM